MSLNLRKIGSLDDLEENEKDILLKIFFIEGVVREKVTELRLCCESSVDPVVHLSTKTGLTYNMMDLKEPLKNKSKTKIKQ